MVGGAVTHPAATPEPCCRYLQVTIADPIDRILCQCRALVRAIEALSTIQPSGPFERAPARLWVSEQILSASEHIGDDRAVLRMSKN